MESTSYVRCIDVCGECPHYELRPQPNSDGGVHICSAITLDEPTYTETLEGHPMVPSPDTPRLRYCPIRSGEGLTIWVGATRMAKAIEDPEERERMVLKMLGGATVEELSKNRAAAPPLELYDKGEVLRIHPFGFPARTATATVELHSGHPAILALSFTEQPPFLGPSEGFVLQGCDSVGAMILFRNIDPVTSVPLGPWTEASDGGHYVIEHTYS